MPSRLIKGEKRVIEERSRRRREGLPTRHVKTSLGGWKRKSFWYDLVLQREIGGRKLM